jgi:transcriptional regulator with XRE-family HTH domain
MADQELQFHERLRALCQAAGIMGAAQLAVAIAQATGDDRPADELSLTGPASWLNGDRTPSVENLQAILHATGGSAEYLIMGRGGIFAPGEGATNRAACNTAMREIMEAVEKYRSRVAANARRRTVRRRG